MGKEEVEKIKREFSSLELYPEYLKHKEVITSEDAAKTRGFELKQGIKAILFTNDSEWTIANVPADKKVDEKKVAVFLGWSKNKIRMAKPEEVLEKTDCQIGAVPPFGHKEKIKILVDKGIYGNEISTFNIGLRTESVKILTKEMKIVFNKLNAIEGDFVKTG